MKTSKSGFTLMELMVYMAILGVIVLIAGEAFSSSTKFRVRTQNMLKASQEAESAAMLLKGDLGSLGAKSSKKENHSIYTDSFDVAHIKQIYIDPNNADDDLKDSSSYILTKKDGFDSLYFKRMRYSDRGLFQSIEEISWFVKDNILKRSCKTIEGTATNDECPKEALEVDMATGVDIFEIQTGKPNGLGDESWIFPDNNPGDLDNIQFRLVPRFGVDDLAYLNVEPNVGGSVITLSGFATNYNFKEQYEAITEHKGNQVFLSKMSSSPADSWKSACVAFDLEPSVEYELSFNMPFSEDGTRMFRPGIDHLAVGFRYNSDGSRPKEIDDFMFYPPTIPGEVSMGERSMRFSVKRALNDLCVAFTFSSYSPVAASGKVNFKHIALKKVESANYKFDGSAVDIYDKKNVKAMLLRLRISRGAKNGGKGETGEATLVMPIPSNGPKD